MNLPKHCFRPPWSEAIRSQNGWSIAQMLSEIGARTR